MCNYIQYICYFNSFWQFFVYFTYLILKFSTEQKKIVTSTNWQLTLNIKNLWLKRYICNKWNLYLIFLKMNFYNIIIYIMSDKYIFYWFFSSCVKLKKPSNILFLNKFLQSINFFHLVKKMKEDTLFYKFDQ